MDLGTYIERNDVSIIKLAANSGIDCKTIYAILKGRCPHLATAVAIEEYTDKKVTCKEMLAFARRKGDKVTQYLERKE
jgi:hypothetical protein